MIILAFLNEIPKIFVLFTFLCHKTLKCYFLLNLNLAQNQCFLIVNIFLEKYSPYILTTKLI